MSRRDFIIICEIRTGSTYLSRFLNGVDGVKMWTKDEESEASYEIFRGKKDLLAEIKEFYSTPFSGMLGTKLPIRHPRRKRMSVIQEIKTRRLRPIYLMREDYVAHLFSIIHAELTSIWHKNGNTREIDYPLEIELEGLYTNWIPRYRGYLNEIDEIKYFLKSKNAIDIFYEDIVTEDGKRYLLEEMGIDWKEEYSDILNEEKILEKDLSEYFSNYEEVFEIIEEEIGVGGRIY